MFLTIIMSFCFVNEPAQVKVTNSGNVPELQLTEELRIGPESDSEHGLWTGPYVSFDVNKKGHMFVADDRENRILEFDESGNFVKSTGRRGEGPGEFVALSQFQVLDDQTCVAFDSSGQKGSITYFDADLNYVSRRVLNTEFGCVSLVFSPDGKQKYCRYTQAHPERGILEKGAALLDENDQVIMKHPHQEVMIFNQQKIRDTDFWARFIASQLKAGYEGQTVYGAFDNRNNYYWAQGSSYHIQALFPNSRPKLDLVVEAEPIFRTEEEMMGEVNSIKDQLDAQLPPEIAELLSNSVIKRAIQLSDYRPNKPPVFGLVIMENGNIVVVHNVNQLTHEQAADIFSPEGTLMGRINNPAQGLSSLRFLGNKLYCLELNEDDERELVRYSFSL